MSLGFFLDEQNRLDREKKNKVKLESEKKEYEDNLFSEQSKTLFVEVIGPAVDNIVDLFTTKGYFAIKGPLFEPKSYKFGQTMTMALKFNDNTLQWDIVGNTLVNKITVYFSNNKGIKPGIEKHYLTTNINQLLLEEIIESDLRIFALKDD